MTFADRLQDVKSKMTTAEKEAGRSEGEVTLVAVSKTFSLAAIRPALEAGQRVFGENRVQESFDKWPALKEAYPDCELHLVGPLQTNKVGQAVQLFDVIETLDREKLAKALEKERQKGLKLPELFIQVNVGEEPQKAGIAPADCADFATFCRDQLRLPVIGLMCIPPLDEPPAPYFALLAKMAEELALPKISMGMSGDYETAIAHGATHIRVGSALFGSR